MASRKTRLFGGGTGAGAAVFGAGLGPGAGTVPGMTLPADPYTASSPLSRTHVPLARAHRPWRGPELSAPSFGA